MEHRANGRAYHGHNRRSCATDRPTSLSGTRLPVTPHDGDGWPLHPPQRSDDTRPLWRALSFASHLTGRQWILGPLVAWALASLLGCVGPGGVTGLFSVRAAPSDEGRGALSPVAATSLMAGSIATTETATPTASAGDTPVAPPQAPEAGQRLAAALPESRRAPQPLASLFLALADAVQRDVSTQAASGTPEAPAAEVAAAEVAVAVESHPPERIRSAAIDLDMAIVPVGWKQVMRDGKTVSMWEVGSHVASWHKTSATPGQTGNMVITGHNNIEGSVFRRVPDLQEGDAIVVEAGGRPYTYTVESMFVVLEKGATPEQKKWNGQWIGAFPDERLTLVTCYPPDGNSHRMIVIAKPSAR